MNQKSFSIIIGVIILLVLVATVVFIVRTLKQRANDTDFKLPDLDKEENKKIKFKSSVSTKIPKSEDEIKEEIEVSDTLTLDEVNKIDNTAVVQSVKLPEIEEKEIVVERPKKTRALDDFDKMIEGISNEDEV